MNYTINKLCSLLLVSFFTGFSSHCMEQNLVENQQETLALSEDSDFFELNQTPEITSMKSTGLPGILYELTENIHCVAFSPDDRTIVTGSVHGNICAWDSQKGTLIHHSLPTAESVTSIACDSSGTTFFTGSFHGTVRQWNLKTGEKLLKLPFPVQSKVNSLACSYNDKLICVAFDNGEARLVSLESKELVFELSHLGHIRWTSFNSDNSVLITESFDPIHTAFAIHLHDAITGKLIKTLGDDTNNPIEKVSYSNDKALVATLFKDHTACVFDTTTGNRLLGVEKEKHPSKSVVISPQGTILFTAPCDSLKGKAYAWDIKAGTKLMKLTKDDGNYDILACSPDEQTFVTSSLHNNIFLRSLKSETVPLQLHEELTTQAVFSPDGKTLLTLSLDRKISVWETETGKKIVELPNTTIGEIQFSPCGKTIFIKGHGKDTPIWVRSGVIQETSQDTDAQSSEKSHILGFTEAINLDDDSQKECSIQ
ncbi:hypothetical protein H0W26_04030 [Candidatus Dependentiae bacterium]|nr:hypothetical protein [Candidatus Dependentiae bacterium]